MTDSIPPIRRIAIVNGKPEVGKDTLVNKCTSVLRAAEVSVFSYSSIDPVRELLAKAGIDTSAKTPEDRDLLAEVGSALEKYSRWRTAQCISQAQYFDTLAGDNHAVLFLHVREAANIERIAAALADRWKTFRVQVVSTTRGKDVTSNSSDAGTDDMHYDVRINNNGTLEDLDVGVMDLCTYLIRHDV